MLDYVQRYHVARLQVKRRPIDRHGCALLGHLNSNNRVIQAFINCDHLGYFDQLAPAVRRIDIKLRCGEKRLVGKVALAGGWFGIESC